ncbi:hypothetical protein ACH5RR_033596 [Cinchona calisaya]|uniref:Pectinesterase inhibitor domain-containing protein n=1 Tax=Cinchona calisaya TaxID=153742 RepID=A0ABD2YLD7_9GENT
MRVVLLKSICVCLAIVSCTIPTRADLVHDVCSKSNRDPNYCEEAIRSAPGSATGDLATLGQVVINLTISQVSPIENLIFVLKRQSTDEKLKERLSSCLEDFNDCRNDLNDCRGLLQAKDYSDLVFKVEAAEDGPDGCDTSFDDGVPPEPDQLKQASARIQVLIEAINIISETLDGSV